MPFSPSHPILSIDEALSTEARVLGGDEIREWSAIQRAGCGVASRILEDCQEIGGLPEGARIAVLAGKGHNAADALVATHALLGALPRARAEIVFVMGERRLRPLTRRAYVELEEKHGKRVRIVPAAQLKGGYDVAIDGIFGLNYRSPLEASALGAISLLGGLPVRLRASVDVPSGLDEPGAFRADFTYATGIVKAPLLSCLNAGRLRYVDIGFFLGTEPGSSRVLLPQALAPLARLRPARSEKRQMGHVALIGGCRETPGAILMAALAAAVSGVGLVSAFVPESLAPAFAARLPEAMWVGCPETPSGGIALEAIRLIEGRISKASAVVVGPGLGRDPETQVLVKDLVRSTSLPLLLDADALMPDIVRLGKSPRILTPHAGEFERIRQDGDVAGLCRDAHAVVVLKGGVTTIVDLAGSYVSFAGGPVLSRGGSGDLLAGLVGGLLASAPSDPLAAACRGVLLHGMAADRLARSKGQSAVKVTDLLDFLPGVLLEIGRTSRLA